MCYHAPQFFLWWVLEIELRSSRILLPVPKVLLSYFCLWSAEHFSQFPMKEKRLWEFTPRWISFTDIYQRRHSKVFFEFKLWLSDVRTKPKLSWEFILVLTCTNQKVWETIILEFWITLGFNKMRQWHFHILVQLKILKKSILVLAIFLTVCCADHG